ncbi:MAG: FKBP-type peptidyl-prolyl cis-trans isomerase [Candidatus Staskawiczbacteria bacterium]|nr:FKBP-type peptidyl-prolyl cis-trans isomerase [Candidatus Staskawiczbacteria bacterium]
MNKILLIIILAIVLIIIAVGFYILIMPKANPVQAPAPAQSQNQNTQTPASYDIQGMKVEILKEGTGEGAKVGDNIVVNYVGTLPDGTKFDSSIDRNQPFPYTLGQNQVIQGWELGLLGMKVGEKRKLTIPPELAYGAAGRPPIIPQNATLIFEIDMLSINAK